MIEKVKNWYNTKNVHPCDDNSFYDIVIESLNGKLREDVFSQAIADKRKALDAYRRYEDLRNCLIYYNKNCKR